MAFDSTVSGASANSYTSVSSASSYLADMGNATAFNSADEADQEAALIRATRYIESRYIDRWPGSIASDTQALSWPRSGAVDREGRRLSSTAIPGAIVAAVSELAVIALTDANLFVNASRTDGGVRREKVKVGPIEQEIEYAGALSVADIDRRVDQILRVLIGSRKLRRT